MRALTWNLYHGRSPEPTGRSLLREFAGALAAWEWEVAMLQEVPPWWPPALGAAAGAEARLVLTSRNFALLARRAISARNPDILKANGGGCNAILVRGAILEHRTVRLTGWPERRTAHGVRLGDGQWVVNVHASTHFESRAFGAPLGALAAAGGGGGAALLVWGGDVNMPPPRLRGLRHVAGNHVDPLFPGGRPAAGRPEVLDRGRLSDHPPV